MKNIINNIPFNLPKDLEEFLKLHNYKIDRIDYKVERGEEVICRDENGNIKVEKSESPLSFWVMQVIVRRDAILLTSAQMFEKYANQIYRFKNPHALNMKLVDSSNQDATRFFTTTPHFNNHSMTYYFIDKIDDKNNITYENIGYKLK